MTFKELKKLVKLPLYKEQRVPTVKALEESGVSVVAEKILENHGSISVYQNGYVIYRAHKRVTVFSLRNCVHYKYDALEGAGHHIEEEEFDEYEWHIRLVLEGEDRIFMNYEIIQGKWMPSREDREYREEILEGVDEAVSTLERMISEERVEELLSTLTDLQRKVVHTHLFHGLSFTEAAKHLGMTRQNLTGIYNAAIYKMHYNPFHYIRSEKDILKLVNTIIANTKGDGEKSGEDFWVKAERLLYCALIGYIYYEAPEEEQNFSTLLEFINASEAREDDEEFKNPVDELFEDLEKAKPEHFAVRQYKKYKLAAGKTAKSILISCGARLAPFDIKELRDLMAYDEMELDMLGDQRTAMFVIISDTDDTFNFVVSILYTQLFNLLCDKADDEHGGRLPYHVRLLLDEFANIGQIPKFDKLIATIRSREISASIILQSQSQLKTIYKDAAETIIGNCDTMLFLGGKESSTLKEISETLGKETIDLYNTSDTRGNSPSFGTNYQKTGKELMSRDELAVMDGSKCILQLRGVRPFLSDKFDITKHKRYKELSDFDKKNEFDVECYLKHELRLLTTEEFDLYEVDVTEQAQE